MKTQYFTRASIVRGAAALLILPFQMLPVAEGATQPQDIEVADIARLCVRVNKIGATGIGKIIGTEGETRYEIDGSELKVYLAPVDRLGEMTIVVDGTYGEIKLHEVIFVNVKNNAESEVEVSPYIFRAIAAGGGADYKTDIYMDGAGRVILERLSDGSTLLLDEHENPIVKRNADGSTQYFDAYQSARLRISASGEVEVTYTEDETTKTLAVAEAILARTQKRLLYNTAGDKTIKDEEGNILTHAQIYAMLMSSPDFVVLVRSDHAFHPDLVTPTQISFTCSYLGADEQISAERVNITSENVVTYSQGKGLTSNKVGGVAIGVSGTSAEGEVAFAQGFGCSASAIATYAQGANCRATGPYSHSEGNGCHSKGQRSHAEGESCTTNAGVSHAEGNFCSTDTNGGSAHAEGSYTNANGAASHTEGYRTITTEGGSHAQGCWNKVEGGQFAFMHGCGTDADHRANAFLITGDQMYMIGIGGYDGTNYGTEGVKSVQTVIRELQLKLVNF